MSEPSLAKDNGNMNLSLYMVYLTVVWVYLNTFLDIIL